MHSGFLGAKKIEFKPTVRANVVSNIVGLLKNAVVEVQEYMYQQLDETGFDECARDIELGLFTEFEKEKLKFEDEKSEKTHISSLWQILTSNIIRTKNIPLPLQKKGTISVEVLFEVPNGFTGMQRDVILRVCRLMWGKEKEIRAVFGMSETHHHWRKNDFF